jgi:GTPase
VMTYYSTTMKVLEELGATDRPMIVAFNKIDCIQDDAIVRGLRVHLPDAHFISVHTGEGIPELLARMEELASPGLVTRTWRIPPEESALLARMHRAGQVHEVRYEGADTVMVATLPQSFAAEVARFVQVAKPQSAASAESDDTFLQTSLVKPTK